MVSDSWFRSLWKTSKKHELEFSKARIGVLAYEVSSLMSKLLHLWQSLTDKQVSRLREEIAKCVGIKKLVSEEDDYIVKLIYTEMMESLGNVARAVARLSKKCNDPLLKSFEPAYNDLITKEKDEYGWQFTWKQMDKKAKKMERFIVMNANLYQEMEKLGELEQELKRMASCDSTDSIRLVEKEKHVAWKHQAVKRLKENSIWGRTYDYTILLLARSIFTIYGRIGDVFGINHVANVGVRDSKVSQSNNNRRNHSTVFMQSSVHPSENSMARFSSGSLGSMIYNSGPISTRTNNMVNFHSGPLGNSTSSPISGRHNADSFYSATLGSPATKSAPFYRKGRGPFKLWQFRDKSSNLKERIHHSGVTTMGEKSNPLSKCYENDEVLDGRKNGGTELNAQGNSSKRTVPVDYRSKLLNPPPETLGAAALSLHYANIVILIEKLVASPHLIGNDERDGLYNMLPASIRTALRDKLKPYAKKLSAYDTVLAGEWNEAISGILDWLAPLAHNMLKWQTERSYEQQKSFSEPNVLLVQTLYYANQERTEAAITELLLGLNYIWRLGREINTKSLVECGSDRNLHDYLDEWHHSSNFYDAGKMSQDS